jgi:hypothetical protein
MCHAGDNGMSPDHNTRNLTIQASVNGKSWKVVEAFKGNTANVTDVQLASVNAR